VIGPEEKSSPSDLIIFAVKSHHLREAIQDIKNRVRGNTLILSIMNGIDSEEQIAAVYGNDKVLFAVAVGIDAVREGNCITYTNPGKLLFGEAKNLVLSERIKQVQSLFLRAGIPYETPDDMIRVLWWKLMINVGINQASAVLRAPYGVFQTSQEARELMESAMREVVVLAESSKSKFVRRRRNRLVFASIWAIPPGKDLHGPGR
jgi:2-dehydropantoate 2-reductase